MHDETVKQGSEPKEWRQEVLGDINHMVAVFDQTFKSQAARSFKRAPLVECHADVFRGYSGALVDTFFHLFSGFVGEDLDMEENLVEDLRERFKQARLRTLEKKLATGQGASVTAIKGGSTDGQ